MEQTMLLHKAPRTESLDGVGPLWLEYKHPMSAPDARAQVAVRVGWNEQAMLVRFDVESDHLRVKCLKPGEAVCKDTCVEFFFATPTGGYRNLEVNAIGTHLFHAQPTQRQWPHHRLDWLIEPPMVRSSLPHEGVLPERPGPVSFRVDVQLPWRLMGRDIAPLPGDVLPCNFYHCADHARLPRWISWSPVEGLLNFHRPECFGRVMFTD